MQARSAGVKVVWQPETRDSLLWIASVETFNIF